MARFLCVTVTSITAVAVAVAAVVDGPGEGTAGAWTKHLLTDYVARGARCLDGSPGGYYLRAGDPSKWLVFHQGGGWCMSSASCLNRASQPLGSSASWGDEAPIDFEGRHLFDHPPFDTYTVVFAMYCDGGSWAGNATDTVDGTTLYYAGAALREAMFDDLMAKRGLVNNAGVAADTPLTVVYGGCSAGGLTAYLHADWVSALVEASAARYGRTGGVTVRGFADALYDLVHDDINGGAGFAPRLEWVAEHMNVKENINAGCAAAHAGEGAPWRCLFGAEVLPYVKTPMFVLNSKYDTWQGNDLLAITNCSDPVTCTPAQRAFWTSYTHELLQRADAAPAQHTFFLTNCAAHCQTGTGAVWGRLRVNGVTLADAVMAWWAAGGDKGQRWISQCDLTACAGDVC